MTLFDVRLVDPANPDGYSEYLDSWSDLSMSVDRKSPGQLAFSYPKGGDHIQLLRQFQVVAFLQDGVESDNCRFLVRGHAWNDINPDGSSETWTFQSLLDAFKDCQFLPTQTVDAPKTRTYTNKTVGYQINEAIVLGQRRNAFDWWGFQGMTFNGVNDTDGRPWPIIESMEREYGQSVYEILSYLVEQGWVEFSMTRGWLNAYNPLTRGRNLAGAIQLEQGHEISDAPGEETWDDFVNELTIVGGETVVPSVDKDGNPGETTLPVVYAHASSGINLYGRREKVIRVAGVQSRTQLELIGKMYLQQFALGPRSSRTYAMSGTDYPLSDSQYDGLDEPGIPHPVPIRDFGASDVIGCGFADGQPPRQERVVVVSLTATAANAGTYLITVGDWLDDRDERVDRLLENPPTGTRRA